MTSRIPATRSVLLILGLLSATALCAQPALRGFTADDLVRLERIASPTLSPDGERVAYLVRQTDYEGNRGITGIFVQPFAGGEALRISDAGHSASQPQWSLDGRTLYYLTARSGSMQVWRHDFGGAGATQVTDYPIDVGSFQLSPDGRLLAFSLTVFPDCPALACTRARLDERIAGKTTGVLYDQLFVRHWDEWKDGRLNQLFVSGFDGNGRTDAEPKLITRGVRGHVPSRPFGDHGEYGWSPDGMSVVFAARIADEREAWSTNFDLYQVAFDGSQEVVNLTPENRALDTGPVFAPDGATLFYRSMQRPGFEADRLAITALTLADGSRRDIAPDWDRSAYALTLSDDGSRVWTIAQDLGQRTLYVIDVASGDARRVASDGTVTGFDVRGDRLVFVRDTLRGPGVLYAANADGSEVRELADPNRGRLAGVAMGEYKQFSFAGWNDETVHGYVMRPHDFEEGKRYPVAFIIHGGPQGSMGNHFHYRWNPQTYAGQGWAVVFIDFHGSTGYGQAFTDSISGDWGGKPLEDLKKGWAHALATYDFLDGDRACALGASYGGYMVNWIAGNWNQPWSCLVSHSGVFDLRMMGYATEELWFTEWEHGGTPFEVPEKYERHNPVNHVADWRVPMLVIHGQRDYRVLVEQGLATFTALQRSGIDSQLLYFPDENHWILKPHNSVQWHDAVNAWLHKHFGEAPSQ
jgi:dipeptidyl aminopeptidase/acylaminoacyl peptidase